MFDSQRLRPTIHEIITSKIKSHAAVINSSRPGIGQAGRTASPFLQYSKGVLESYQVLKQKRQNGANLTGALLAVSPVSQVMAPMGAAQAASCELLNIILDTIVRILGETLIHNSYNILVFLPMLLFPWLLILEIVIWLENHVIVGEFLESKSSQQSDIGTPNFVTGDINWNPDSEASQVTGGYSVGFSLMVVQVNVLGFMLFMCYFLINNGCCRWFLLEIETILQDLFFFN